VESSTLAGWQRQIELCEGERRTSVEARLAEVAVELLGGGDPRFRTVSGAQARALGQAQVQGWLDALVGAAPVEVALVGDLASERAAAVQASSAARPYRGGTTAWTSSASSVRPAR
jgi:hypothetical protein